MQRGKAVDCAEADGRISFQLGRACTALVLVNPNNKTNTHMKKTDGSMHLRSTSRRDFITDAGLAVALGISRWLPLSPILAQTGTPSSKLIVRSENPQDLETPINLLDTWITPNDLFYVRSHLYTPKIDMGTWRLQIDGMVDQPLSVTLEDLKKYPAAMQVVTLE